MKLVKSPTIWLDAPEKHDYPAAEDYLSLLYPDDVVYNIQFKLLNSAKSFKKAKDIVRASNVSLLGVSNGHVKKNLKKVKRGEKLSPILLVVDTKHNKLVIADGYHRLCAAYRLSEDTLIPCIIATI